MSSGEIKECVPNSSCNQDENNNNYFSIHITKSSDR